MVAVPETKSSWTNGVDALSSTNLHAYLRDPLKFVMAPPIAELRQTAGQALTNNTWTPITMGVEDVDTDVDGIGGHSTASNTSRYVARYPGWYQVSGGVGYAPNATGVRGTRWGVNGTSLNASATVEPANAASLNYPARTKQVFLNAGDYVELLGFQNSGGSLNTVAVADQSSGMSVRWVSL